MLKGETVIDVEENTTGLVGLFGWLEKVKRHS